MDSFDRLALLKNTDNDIDPHTTGRVWGGVPWGRGSGAGAGLRAVGGTTGTVGGLGTVAVKALKSKTGGNIAGHLHA